MPPSALEGIRILDLSQVWAGPLASRILADMGAEVIHVEACQRIDFVRFQTLAENESRERYWERGWGSWLRRNKYGITLNLSDPRGIDILKRLIKISDVIMENFAPRVMENFGLQYDVIKEIKPDIVMLSMSAFGQTGPYRDYVGYGASIEPVAGLSELAGYPDGPPTELDSNISDPSASFHGAGVILAALLYRDRTGKGQYIDLSEMETVMTFIGGQILDYTMNKRIQGRIGNRHSSMAPHGCYPCKGDDKWVAIAVRSEEEWRHLCAAMNNPDWTKDERFSDMPGRWKNQDELNKCIGAWTKNFGHYEVMHMLQGAGVPAAAVLNVKEILLDEHVKERGFLEMVDHPEVGRRPMPTMSFKMSKTPGSIRKSGHLLGEDNEYILGKLLGITEPEMVQLTETEVIGKRPIPLLPPDIVPISGWEARDALYGVDPDYLDQLGVTTEGEDKPIKYPVIFSDAQIVVLTKTDLIPYLDWDIKKCRQSIQQINPRVFSFELSAKTDDGMGAWINYLEKLTS